MKSGCYTAMFFSAVSIKSARMSYTAVSAMLFHCCIYKGTFCYLLYIFGKRKISRLCMLIFFRRIFSRVKCRYHTAMLFSVVSIRAAIFMARRFFEYMLIMGYLTVVPIWLVCSYWLVSLLLVLQFVTSVNMCCVPIWMG